METLQAALNEFVDDPTNITVFVLIALDFLFGVTASFVQKTFRLSYLSDFLRTDVLGKVVPYFAIWWALHLTGDVELGDLELVEEAIGVAVIAALLASVLNSLRDLKTPGVPGTTLSVTDAVAGPDPTTPM